MYRNFLRLFVVLLIDLASQHSPKEWLINVPILHLVRLWDPLWQPRLVLAGCCALNRSVEEVSKPLVVTNIYIIFAWMAHFISDFTIRWSLVSVTFLMYAWASKDMVAWAQAYTSNAEAEAWGGYLRTSEQNLEEPLETMIEILSLCQIMSNYVKLCHSASIRSLRLARLGFPNNLYRNFH